MWPTQPQPPGVPDVEQLSKLHPAVAVAFLIFLALVVTLWYFGASIRDRITPKKPDPTHPKPPDVTHAITVGAPPLATPAFDRATAAEDTLREYLLQQIQELKDRVSALEEENRQLRADRDRDRAELDRYRYYRPPPGWEQK